MRYHAYRIASSWKIASHARWDGGAVGYRCGHYRIAGVQERGAGRSLRGSGAARGAQRGHPRLSSRLQRIQCIRGGRTHPHEPRVRVRQPWHGREVAADDAAPRRGRHRRQNRLRASHQRRRAQGKHGARGAALSVRRRLPRDGGVPIARSAAARSRRAGQGQGPRRAADRPRRRPGAYEAERARGRDGLEAAVLRVRPARGRPVLVLRHARLGVLWAGDGEGRVRDRRVGQRVPLPRSYPGVRILRLGQR